MRRQLFGKSVHPWNAGLQKTSVVFQRRKGFCWSDCYLLSSLSCCSLPLIVRDFNWPSSVTSTRSTPFSTTLSENRGFKIRTWRLQWKWACFDVIHYFFVVIFLPLMILVDVDTDLKFPPPPPLPNEEDEKEANPPPPMSENEPKPE